MFRQPKFTFFLTLTLTILFYGGVTVQSTAIAFTINGDSKMQTGPKSLTVGISPFSPFVIDSAHGIEGFSIDLWRAVASTLNVEYRFVKSKIISGTLDDVVEKRVDVALGGISINSEREALFDFTYPFFQSGLGILVMKSSTLGIIPLFRSFFTVNKLLVVFSFLFFLVISGHIIWFIEKRIHGDASSFSSRYFPGVIEGIYWAMVTASTVGYGDQVAKSLPGRILTLMLIVIALPLFAYFTATLASNITIQKLRSAINSPQDLMALRVGVLDGSTSQEYFNGFSADVYAFDNIDDAYLWLIKGRLDAVVSDRPSLQYYAQHGGKGKVTVVGNAFSPQQYAMAIPEGSPLQESLNRVLLTLREQGIIEKIRYKWFGSD